MSTDSEILKEATRQRGEILDGIASVEETLNYFISIHFFKSINIDFISKVLEHPYFGLELRTQIVGAILKEHYSKINFPFKEWQELQKIRNVVAHAPKKAEVTINPDGTRTMSSVFYPYRGEQWNTDQIFGSYVELLEVVKKGLEGLPNLSLQVKPFEETTTQDLTDPSFINRIFPKKK